jgi:hypothetical protein
MINFLSLLPLATKVLLCKTLFRYPHPFSPPRCKVKSKKEEGRRKKEKGKSNLC